MLDIKYRFTCGRVKLHQNVTKVQIIMSKMVWNLSTFYNDASIWK